MLKRVIVNVTDRDGMLSEIIVQLRQKASHILAPETNSWLSEMHAEERTWASTAKTATAQRTTSARAPSSILFSHVPMVDDVFMDHAGFSTYESMYRARDVFGAKRIVVVSQGYHLYRALYVAERLGLDAYGVPADLRPYAGQERDPPPT